MPDSEHARAGDTLCCADCGSRLAHDQGYCVECGARRGPLPASVAGWIAALFEQGRPVEESCVAAGTEADQTDAGIEADPGEAVSDSRGASWLPGPWAAAAGVLGTLAFGVVAGSVVGSGGLGVPASAPVLLAVTPSSTLSASPPPAPPIPAVASSGGSAIVPASALPSAAPQQAATVFANPTTVGSGAGSGSSGASNLLGLPPIKHIFLIVLSGQGYAQTFGSKDKYFAKTLRAQGEVVQNYFAVTAGPLANAIGLISGQGPTQQTALGCPVFGNVAASGQSTYGQTLGKGCVYPAATQTLADQLSTPKQGGWKAYVEGINQGPAHQPTTCRHPAIGAVDADQSPRLKDPYVTWRNPFVYFHSLLDTKSCQKSDVALTQLTKDLKTKAKTAALTYIAPSPCDDGTEEPCTPSAKPPGLAAADKFLQSVLPGIERSPAYKADGLIAITFDQAPQTGPTADPRACCDAQTFPNLPSSTLTTPTTPGVTTPGVTTTTTTPSGSTSTTPPASTTTTTTTTTSTTSTGAIGGGETTPTGGGGQVGLLLISRYVKPGSLDEVDYYNHFSLLATIENIFGLKHLGYASDASLPVMDAAVFNAHAL